MIIVYNILDFDVEKAKNGALCAVIATEYFASGDPTTITNGSSSFLGIGICKEENNDRSSIVIAGVKYVFNRNGIAFNRNAANYCLKLVEISTSDGESARTRASSEDNTEITEYKKELVARILPAIISRIDREPSELSNNEVLYYCQEAYRWADSMVKVYNPQSVVEEEVEEES